LQWNVAAVEEVSDRQTACAGTLVTNSDGTRSCVVQVGVSSTGYPIYKVIENIQCQHIFLLYIVIDFLKIGHQPEHWCC
jgi:hypothetical protein